MQFKVPQFIDIEDKLFGPFTFREFAYLVGGGGMIFVLYRLLPFWVAILPILFVAGLTLLLTFYKINNKPFIYYLQAGINYAISSKLYIWKQRLVKSGSEDDSNSNVPQKTSVVPMVSQNSLKDLSWNLDIQEKGSK
ncbi:PrgI family protein [Candidatus Nomurabacteria bacterium]|nr:PrgI family protein [Candidatus Nomurabacteria bacterium]